MFLEAKDPSSAYTPQPIDLGKEFSPFWKSISNEEKETMGAHALQGLKVLGLAKPEEALEVYSA